MKKITTLTVFQLIFFGCIFIGGTVYYNTHKSPEYRLERLSKKNSSCQNIIHALKAARWQEAGDLIIQALRDKSLTHKNLEELASYFPNTPFSYAFKASQAILSLNKTGLTVTRLLPISIFKETHSNAELENESYIPESRFGREVQFDPETGHFFIHLGTHNVKPLGKGRVKVVTKTVLYDREHPTCFARAVTSTNVANEIESMKALKGKPGIINGISFLHHQDPESQGNCMKILFTI